MTAKRYNGEWQPCRFQTTREGIQYCILKKEWCNSSDCKEQMIE
jgi:hypothetical protein